MSSGVKKTIGFFIGICARSSFSGSQRQAR
jgi:hypothetical protein